MMKTISTLSALVLLGSSWSHAASLIVHFDFDTPAVNKYITNMADGSSVLVESMNSGAAINADASPHSASPGSLAGLGSTSHLYADTHIGNAMTAGISNNSFVMSFWIKLVNDNDTQTVLGNKSADSKTAQRFCFTTGGDFQYGIQGSSGAFVTLGTVAFGSWNNVAVCYDGTTNTFSCAINGVVVNTSLGLSGNPIPAFTEKMQIGSTNFGASSRDGLGTGTRLDELKFYSYDPALDQFAQMAGNEYQYGDMLIPEPATCSLSALGLAALLFRRRKPV